MKRFIQVTSLLWLVGGCQLIAQQNAGDSGWLAQAEADALAELDAAYASKNYLQIKEAAEQLESIEKQKKAAATGTEPNDSPVGTDTFKKLQKMGISLTRSPDAPFSDKAARFGYTKNFQTDSDAVIDAEFYLRKTFPAGTPQPKHIREGVIGFNSLAVSVQGKLSSGDETKSDAWRFRIEDRFFTSNSNENRIFDGLIFDFAVKEESDRDFDVARLSGELMTTANKQDIFMGRYSGKADNAVQFRWRPWVGADIGDTLKGEQLLSAETDDIVRLIARGTADLQLNFLTKALSLKNSRLYVDNTLQFLPDSDETYNYLKTGLEFSFNDYVGMGFDYTFGRDAPMFAEEEMFKASFTVKF